MIAPSIDDLARVSLPNRGQRGMFAMLEFYFDDSGTHDSSRVAVWGGFVAYKDFVGDFEAAWKERLAKPCNNKPPIKAFHSSHLAAGDGEFEGYNQAERDLTRYNFRKVIVDAGLTILSFGISVRDWDDIVRGPARVILGTGERLIFGQAVLHGCKAAQKEGQPLSFQFDVGRRSPALDSIIQPAIEVAETANHSVSYGFSRVIDRPALQAADLVAHETYQFFTKYIDDPEVAPAAHLQRLFGDAHDASAAWFGREQIQSMVDQMEPTFKLIDPTWGQSF